MSSNDSSGVLHEFDRLQVTERPSGLRLEVLVRPRSSRSSILGVREGLLDVALTAPPVDGEANAELLKLLSRALGVPRSGVAIVLGMSSRRKVVEVGGLAATDVRARLQQAKR